MTSHVLADSAAIQKMREFAIEVCANGRRFHAKKQVAFFLSRGNSGE
jgi:hypothetical protein